MSIVGGLDIHRSQITFDYLDTQTGEARCGQVRPADRDHLRAWLARFAGRDGDLVMEGCTGWRYVAEEVAAAGLVPHVADPAELAALRGRKRHAKTDRADARFMREQLQAGRVPESWVPPPHVLEYRALLQACHDLRADHTAWVQRIQAVLFHQGAPRLGQRGLGTADGQARLAVAAAALSPAGQQQVAVALQVTAVLEERLAELRRQLADAARHLAGARELQARLYGVGPVTALALTCWLGGAGRFSSARKAVRFAGLDVTVHSSAGKRSPGHLSRQGPAVLRWSAYEAGKAHARGTAPDHAYYAAVKDRIDGKRAALSEARKIIRQAAHILAELGQDALAPC
jgi:transposase